MDIELFKFAFFPDFENRIKELAENLADKENWDFSTGGRKNSILKNYIFHTFSKIKEENKDAEIKISNALKEIKKLEDERGIKSAELETEKSSINQKMETAKNAVWKIKIDYSGGDRVLELCLEGYKGSKDNLFNHIVGLAKPIAKPTKSIEDLKTDLQSISGDNAQKYSLLSLSHFA